jgi:hypothetical protein
MGQGKDIVKRLIAFTKNLPHPYTLIIEYDVSRITIHHKVFPLYAMKLLTTGQSWYNSLGFYEDQYERNSECIKTYIEKPQAGSGKPPKTVRQYFTEVVARLMELSKKPTDELSQDEILYISQMHTKITNKYKDLEKTCHLTANNKLSELVYRGYTNPSRAGGRRKRYTKQRRTSTRTKPI